MNIVSHAFSEKLQSAMRDGVVTYGGFNCQKVTGKLASDMVIASIEIIVPPDQCIRESPPVVWCHERWMRDDDDWHNSKDTGMCWVLREQWCDEMTRADLSHVDLVNFGSLWLITAVANLIDRHYVGFYRKLKKWPKGWVAYSHSSKGAKEYERDKRQE